MVEVVLELATAPTGAPQCVRLPGWAVVGVAALLTAPRLVREYLSSPEG